MIWQLARLYGWFLEHFRRAELDRDERDINTMHALARQHRYDSWEHRDD